MNNENDMKFNIITECANRILSLQADLKKTNSEEEKEQLAFFMSEQEQLIKEYTDASINYILGCVTKLNNAKQTLETEKDPKKRKMLESTLNTYTGFIKSKIKDEPLIEESNETEAATDAENRDKCAQYRASQKYDLDILSRAKILSQMCEEHQVELKTEEQRRKEAFRKRIIITMNNEYFKL